MKREASSTRPQRLSLSTHLAAGMATLLLSVPVVIFLNRTEPVGVVATTVALGLIYGILCLLYRAIGDAAMDHSDTRAGAWVPIVSGVAAFLAGATWATWVWLMDMPLASIVTYVPLLAAGALLWGALVVGSVVQVRMMHKASVRVVA